MPRSNYTSPASAPVDPCRAARPSTSPVRSRAGAKTYGKRAMKLKVPIHLNIRQKIIVSFALLLVVTGTVGGMSYSHLVEIERKQRFVHIADDLSNMILEARRYEKNYLLYNSAEDLDESRSYYRQAVTVLETISPEVQDFKGAPLLEKLRKELARYKTLMEEIAVETSPDQSVQDQLREHGKALVALSQELVTFERNRVLKLVKYLKTQLLISMGLLIFVGGWLVAFAGSKIIKPLGVIERTTRRIAQGDFRPLEVLDTRDETQRVVEGFNTMITELEKRQDQLLQAKKLSSLGTLTSGIAHQLNNPLNNISTSCQILLEESGEEGEFRRRMLSNIEQEVHRARDIVRGLLEFSRTREFCLAPTSLNQVVDRSISLMSSQIPPGIEIVKNVPDGLTLKMDAQRMQQVFLNLMENAVHAIVPPGQIRISARHDPAEKQVLIFFEDTGNGIDEKDIGRIFDPFFTTKEVGLGTGLGLSIAFGIIQKHQGSISVESKQSQGTRFTIRLPLEMVC